MALIATLAAILILLFVLWRVRYRYPPADVPQVLCYHKISDKFCFEGTWMTPKRFVGQIDRLVADGFEFVGEDEFIDAMRSPAAGNNAKVLLTFDDGYEQLFDMYGDHLERRGIPLLVFLATDYVGRENRWDLGLGRRPFKHLSWAQIEDLAGCGVRFGSHSASHRNLTHLEKSDLANEITGSRAVIEQHIGGRVRSFSYPFGRYDEEVRSMVMDAGYEVAFSLYPPCSNEVVDPYALRRNGVYIIDTSFSISCKLRRNPLFWFEEMKCRAINGVALLTPLFKRFSARPGK